VIANYQKKMMVKKLLENSENYLKFFIHEEICGRLGKNVLTEHV